jgi:hypothetical protein
VTVFPRLALRNTSHPRTQICIKNILISEDIRPAQKQDILGNFMNIMKTLDLMLCNQNLQFVKRYKS